MISAGFIKHLENVLTTDFGQTFRILRTSAVSGGCINHAHKLETTAGNYFLKYNSNARYPGMFEAEAKGLEILKNTGTIHVPDVIRVGVFHAFSFILLEFIESEKPAKNYWEKAGLQLANLHRCTSTLFGLDHNNYIGSIPQSNKQGKYWIDFFLEERLLAIGAEIVNPFIDKLEKRVEQHFPIENPSLSHGDLWSGNIMPGAGGEAFFYDPAIYYGHREMDLSMTRLFGGFPNEFYEAYNSFYPLQSGFQERMDLYNLYPLLVHVKLFGGSYLEQALGILKRL